MKANAVTPDIIRITGGGPYNEGVMINTSVTVKGDGYRPILNSPPTAGGPHSSVNGNAIAIYTDSGSGGDITVNLENLVVIPDKASAPTRGIRANNNATGLSTDKMTINITDVIVTANNGSDLPVTTDGMSKADLTGCTIFGDDGIYFSGYVDVSLTRTIVSNIYGGTASNDGLLFYPDTTGYTCNVGEGCVFSYMNRLGVQIATDGSVINMIGTAVKPIYIKGNWASKTYATPNAGLGLFCDDEKLTSSQWAFQYVYIVDNFNGGILCSFVNDTDSFPVSTFDHCIIANNNRIGLDISDDLLKAWTFTNCTIANNSLDAAPPATNYVQININESAAGISTGSVSFLNSIIAGNGSSDNTSGNNTINILATAIGVNFSYSAIVLEGPYKLAGTDGFTLGTGVSAATVSNIINADPAFVSIDSASASFLDVNASIYGGKASGGANLSGAADYVATPPTPTPIPTPTPEVSAAKNWSRYE